MIQQHLDNLPAELRDAARYFAIDHDKRPKVAGWNNPANQRTAAEVEPPVGFDICGHGTGPDYLVFDFDNVRNPETGEVMPEVEPVVNLLLDIIGPTWAEVSQSGAGLHVVAIPTAGKWPDMASGQRYSYKFSGKAKLEIFYRGGGRYFIWTGAAYRCEPGQAVARGERVDDCLYEFLQVIDAQNPPPVEAPKSAAMQDAGDISDASRAAAMLDYIDAATLDRADWLRVGMALKSCGCGVDVWARWSATDPARYHPGECEKLWDGFKRQGVTIATLHYMARQGGYDERAFRREYYRQQQGDIAGHDRGVALAWDDVIGGDDEQAIEGERMNDETKEPAFDVTKYAIGAYLLNGEADRLRAEYAALASTSTGFPELDKELGGGIYPGVFVLAGTPGVGKTSFSWQVAESIAAQGRTVLFFGLEMRWEEMLAKSISRHSFLLDEGQAITAQQYLRNSQAPIVEKARVDFMEKTFPRLCYIEAGDDCTVKNVEEFAAKVSACIERPPIVFIDFFQLMELPRDRDGHLLHEREGIDHNIKALTRLSRKLNTTIFAISSMNRSSYKEPLQYSGLKESGSIEYAAACVLGLYPEVMVSYGYHVRDCEPPKKGKRATTEWEKDCILKDDKKKTVGALRLECLKNRGGSPSFEVSLDYHKRFNHFQDVPLRDPDVLPWNATINDTGSKVRKIH